MPSVALDIWRDSRLARLDELEEVHAIVGLAATGRRASRLQITWAYSIALCAHFQGFCRDLHSESADHLVAAVEPRSTRQILRGQISDNRKLDRGNPNPGNIGHDFGRLGVRVWSAAVEADSRTSSRRELLDTAVAWRNAIAHQDFVASEVATSMPLRIREVRRWRSALDALASTFDRVLAGHLESVTGHSPW